MIPFRNFLRGSFLSTVGTFRTIAPAIHILNGHVIGTDCRGNKDRFRTLLAKLSRAAKFVRAEAACQLISSRQLVSEPLIAFTFDDGFEDCYNDIAPVLEEFDTNAILFINPNFITGDSNYIDNFLKRKVPKIPSRRPMNAEMIRDLAERGFIIGAHTMDHEKLNLEDPSFLYHQITECKSAVEKISGRPCDYFAWTYGGYSDISEAAIQVATDQYKFVFSSDRYSLYTCYNRRIFNRRHFECDWPFSHLKYFLSFNRHY
jgi:peptidoglycan/xylan/chitin deacetylase (PgdA/CDA1 family)